MSEPCLTDTQPGENRDPMVAFLFLLNGNPLLLFSVIMHSSDTLIYTVQWVAQLPRIL